MTRTYSLRSLMLAIAALAIALGAIRASVRLTYNPCGDRVIHLPQDDQWPFERFIVNTLGADMSPCHTENANARKK